MSTADIVISSVMETAAERGSKRKAEADSPIHERPGGLIAAHNDHKRPNIQYSK